MIHISSVIEGFKVTQGCLPLQASLLTMLALLIDPQIDPDIYWVLIVSHSLSLVLVIVNMLKPTKQIYMATQCLNIVSLFLQNIVIIYSVQTLL